MSRQPTQLDRTRLDRAVASSRVLGFVDRSGGDHPDEAGTDTPASSGGHHTDRAHQVSARLKSVVTGSRLYRWFTAEPEPEVIVIDLRETRTVGPALALLDRVVDPLVRATSASRTARTAERLGRGFVAAPVRHTGVVLVAASAVALLVGSLAGSLSVAGAVALVVLAVLGLAGTTEDRSLPELAETRPYELLAAAFEPPEPPTEEPEACTERNRSASTDMDRSASAESCAAGCRCDASAVRRFCPLLWRSQ